jgi:hypothetical protein
MSLHVVKQHPPMGGTSPLAVTDQPYPQAAPACRPSIYVQPRPLARS